MSTAIKTKSDLAAAIDRIGVAQDLHFLLLKGEREAVAARLTELAADHSLGETHQVRRAGRTEGEISARRFYNLFKSGKITEAQFISAISVGRTAALEFMTAPEVEKLTTRTDGTPRCTFSRQKGVEPELAARLRELADYVEAEGIGE